ncbi:hypothetical protein C8Q70DRAFT_285725 [Cubamyces menziesii]|uniref:Uncharacterized protein n=1 Tax=Trametes cubensis TaxID=1111947 RepID=A0AAD7XFW6_9APHY|nr:hypothetical protein C8Q70DRAFT_285725 [Cubamyces menziesii]KAJ8501932.1 hypothetical protein ONZ51_g303 [Trametes cubensis]
MKTLATFFLSLAVLVSVGVDARATTKAEAASSADPATPTANHTQSHALETAFTSNEKVARYYSVQCVWYGTSPFCAGECPQGFVQDGEPSSHGSGFPCWTGTKVLCCPLNNGP